MKKTGAQLILEVLLEHGVDTVFASFFKSSGRVVSRL